MNLKHEQIIRVFESLKALKLKGVWFSGIKNKGEYKEWWDNDQLYKHCFYNDKSVKEGEYKRWHENGQLYIHCFFNDEGNLEGEYKEWYSNSQLVKYKLYKNDEVIKDYLE